MLVLAQAADYRVENAFYLTQQSTEKALKAVPVHQGIAIPMIPDLSALLGKLPEACDEPIGRSSFRIGPKTEVGIHILPLNDFLQFREGDELWNLAHA